MSLTYFSGNNIRGLSSDTKPTTAQDKAVFYQTDDFKTFDFNLSSTTWTERSSGGEAVVGDTISFPHTTTAGDYTKTGTISFSNFESNGNEGSMNSYGLGGYANGAHRTSYWTVSTSIGFSNQYVVTLTMQVGASSSTTISFVSLTINYTDGTTQSISNNSTTTINKQINDIVYVVSGGYVTNYPQVNFSGNYIYSLGNTASDIQAELETGTTEESTPYAENVFSQGLVSAIDINPVSPRNTVSKIKIEAWVNSAWVLMRKTTSLGKIRMNLVNTNKIRVTGIDSTNKRMSIDKFRIYTKTTNDVYSHGHVSMDSTDDTLGHSGV
jgi:hypothetical protein